VNILLGRLRYRWQGDITEDIRELGSEYVKQNKPVGSKRNNNQATSTSLQTRAAEILNAFRSVLQFSDPGWNILVYTWSVRKVSDLWPGKRNWLTWSV